MTRRAGCDEGGRPDPVALCTLVEAYGWGGSLESFERASEAPLHAYCAEWCDRLLLVAELGPALASLADGRVHYPQGGFEGAGASTGRAEWASRTGRACLSLQQRSARFLRGQRVRRALADTERVGLYGEGLAGEARGRMYAASTAVRALQAGRSSPSVELELQRLLLESIREGCRSVEALRAALVEEGEPAAPIPGSLARAVREGARLSDLRHRYGGVCLEVDDGMDDAVVDEPRVHLVVHHVLWAVVALAPERPSVVRVAATRGPDGAVELFLDHRIPALHQVLKRTLGAPREALGASRLAGVRRRLMVAREAMTQVGATARSAQGARKGEWRLTLHFPDCVDAGDPRRRSA